jgi:hypothetical protein
LTRITDTPTYVRPAATTPASPSRCVLPGPVLERNSGVTGCD